LLTQVILFYVKPIFLVDTFIILVMTLILTWMQILCYAEVQKAADAVAVAASAEFDKQIFQETRRLVPTSKIWTSAQSYVNLNTVGLSAKGVYAFVTGIQLSGVIT
jgi:hypothetical protein